MARRRVPSRRGGDLFRQVYEGILARERMQEQATLQRQNTELQNRLQTERMTQQEGINTEQQLLGRVLSNPAEARRLVGDRPMLGGASTGTLLPGSEELMGPEFSRISAAKDFASLPTEQSLLGGARTRGIQIGQAPTFEDMPPELEDTGTPTGFGPYTDPAVQRAMDMRQAQHRNITTANEAEMQQAGATTFLQNLEGGRGSEMATAEAFPAELQRGQQTGLQENRLRVGLEQQLTPIMAERARQEAEAKAEVEASQNDIAGLIGTVNAGDFASRMIAIIEGPPLVDQQGRRVSAPDALLARNTQGQLVMSEGAKSATGFWGGIGAGLRSPSVTARRNQLINQGTLNELVQLRSQIATGASPVGQASDRDMQVVMDGFSLLNNPRIDDATAERELQRIHGSMSRLRTRAAEATQALRGAGRLPSSRQLPTSAAPGGAPAGRYRVVQEIP